MRTSSANDKEKQERAEEDMGEPTGKRHHLKPYLDPKSNIQS